MITRKDKRHYKATLPQSPDATVASTDTDDSCPDASLETQQRNSKSSPKKQRTSLPHGICSLILVLLGATGWFFSLWQGDGCNYAIVSGPIVDQLDPSYTSENPITTLELGFDSFRELPDVLTSLDVSTPNDDDDDDSVADPNQSANNNKNSTISTLAKSIEASFSSGNSTDNLLLRKRTTSCTEYPPEVTAGIVDSKWTTSRSFAFLGLVLGGAMTTFLACSVCFVFSRVTWKWTGYGLLLASTLQTLSLVAWFSTQLCSWNHCGWSLGSVSDLCAAGIWFLTGLIVVCHYPNRNEQYHQQPNNNNTAKKVDDNESDGIHKLENDNTIVVHAIPTTSNDNNCDIHNEDDVTMVQAHLFYGEDENVKALYPDAEIA